MKKILLILYLTYIALGSNAVEAYGPLTDDFRGTDSILVSGQFINAKSNRPLSLSVINIQTSQLTLSVILDSKGMFSVKIPSKITEISFQADNFSESVRQLKAGSAEQNLGKIMLLPVQALTEVTVTGQSANDKQLPFKNVYKVKPPVTSEAPVVKSFLKTLPEISFVDEKFLADGSKEVVFYLNGIRSGAESILRLPLDLIDKVEVINNPALMRVKTSPVTIVNVLTKKGDAATYGLTGGLSGAVINKMLGVNAEPYFTKKDLLVTASVNTYKNNSRDEFYNAWQPSGVQLAELNETGASRNSTKPVFFSTFIQKDLAKKLQLSINFDFSDTRITSDRSIRNVGRYAAGVVRAYAEDVQISRSTRDFSGGGELAYKSEKTNLFLNAGITDSKFGNLMLDNFSGDLSGRFNNSLNSSSTDYAAQLSAEHTFSDILSSRIGLLYTWRNVDSELSNVAQGAGPGTNLFNTNDYKERNLGAFMGITLSLPVATVDIGLREEHSRNFSRGNLYYDRYLFIPQVYIFKKFKKSGTLSLSAYRTVDTPSPLSVNPGGTSTNINNANFGNAFLEREISDKIELTHNVSLFKKFRIAFNSSANYVHVKNLIGLNGYRYSDSLGQFLRMQNNIGTYSMLTLYVGATKSVKKIGYFRLGLGYNRHEYDLTDSIIQDINEIVLRSSMNVNLSKKISSSLAFSYRNKNASPYTLNTLRPNLTLSVNGKFLKNTLYAEASWSNLLGLNNKRFAAYQSASVNRYSLQNQFTQNVSFAITYVLGKKNNREASANRGIEKQGVKTEN